MLRKILLFFFCFLLGGNTFANPVSDTPSPDLLIDASGFSTTPTFPVEGRKTRIYITLKNTSPTQDMRGVVRAYDDSEKKQIEVEQSFSVLKNNTANLFFDFIPEKKGVHSLVFRIIPWEEYSDNQSSTDVWTAKIFVDGDSDRDGAGDQIDAFPNDSAYFTPLPSVLPEVPTPASEPIQTDIIPIENAQPPVLILSQMTPFSIRRGENFIINSGQSRGVMGENLITTWEIFDETRNVLIEKETPELEFSVSWVGNYFIKATVTNESGISSVKEIPFSVRFSWRDFFFLTGTIGLLGCAMWWLWRRKK